MSDLLQNFAYCTTTAAITSNTQVTIAVDETSRLPTNAQLSAQDFYMTFESTLAANTFEIVKVTNKSTTSGAGTLTIVRGQDGTTAQSSIGSGTVMKASLTAGMMARIAAATTGSATTTIPLPFGGDYRSTAATGTWSTTTGQDISVTGAASAVNRILVDTGKGRAQNTIYSMDLVTIPGGTPSYGMFFAAVDENNGYIVEASTGGGNGTLFKWVAGVATSIGSLSSKCIAGDTIVAATTATTINIYRIRAGATTLLISVTDTTFTGGTMMGPYVFDALTMKWANAQVTTQTATQPSIPSIGKPQGTFLRRYTFDADTQSWTTTGGTLTQTSGRLQIAVTSGRQVVLEPSTASNVADGEFYVDIWPQVADGSGLNQTGIVFRATDASNHYALLIDWGNYSAGTDTEVNFFKVVSGSYTQLGNASLTLASPAKLNSPIVLNANAGPVRAMVRFVGSTVQLWLNETFVGAWTDTTYTTGRVGVSVGWSTSGTATVQYDNASVYSLPSTWSPANYDPIPTTTVATPPLVSYPQGTQQRQYTFDTSTLSWVAAQGTLSNVSGKLRYTYASAPSTGCNFALEPSTVANVADGEVWADIYPVTSGGDGYSDAGIIFRATDASNFYFFGVRAATSSTSPTTNATPFFLSKVVAGSFTTVQSSQSVTWPHALLPLLGNNSGPWRVLIRFVGSVIQCYVNETLVLAVTDTAFTTGRVGTYIGSLDNSGTPVVDFDNITVLSLPSTWTPAPYTPITAAGDSSWTAPTLLNSWVNFGSGYQVAGYRKDAMGFVHLRGLVKNGTLNSQIFALPAGYRPAATSEVTAGSSTVGFVDVQSSGAVFQVGASSTSFVNLDGMTFYAEN